MKNKTLFAAMTLACAVAASCTVKEDRGPCPCLLTVDLTHVGRVDAYADLLSIDVTTQHGWNGFERFSPDSLPPSCELRVPKDTFYVLALHGGGTQLHRMPFRIVIPEGEEMEPISTGVDSLYCNWEEISSRAELWKNYAELYFVLGRDFDRSVCDFSAEVRGDVCGINLINNLPIKGNFICKKTFKGDTLSIKVPRLDSHSLSMTLYREDIPATSFDIGRELADRNYDWSSQVLRNVTFTIDYNRLSGAFSVEGWKYENIIKEEI